MQPRQPAARSAKIMRHAGASEVTQGVPYSLDGGANNAPAAVASTPRAPPLPPVPSAAPSLASGHMAAAQALLSLNASPMVFAPHSRVRTDRLVDTGSKQVAALPRAPAPPACNPINPNASASTLTEPRKTTRNRVRASSSASEAVLPSSHLPIAAAAAAAAPQSQADLLPTDFKREESFVSNPRSAIASATSRSASLSVKNSLSSSDGSSTERRALPERTSKLFTCPKCSFQFGKSCHLVDHELAVHSGEEKPFACAFCDHRCMRSSQLTRHTLQVHSEERPYVCDRENCHYRCLTSGDMSRHLRSVHLAERNFSCDLCEYKCSNNSRLQSHKRSMHLGPRLHTCDWDGCQFQCKRAGSMVNHKKRVHNAE